MSRPLLVWFRNDLRLHDHEPLSYALSEDRPVIPLYCVDPRHFNTVWWDLPKTGPFRARFLLESLNDLRASLEAKGSSLVVREGRPEDVIPKLVEQHDVAEVTCYEQLGTEERDVEDTVLEAIEPTDADMAFFWGHTLYHIDDLPFSGPEALPDVFTPTRKKLEKESHIREIYPVPDSVPPLPDGLDAGRIPTMNDLGFDHDGVPDERSVLPFKGGETRALARVDEYIWRGDHLKRYKKTRNGLLGADYSSKFSAWLAHGCVSPRHIYNEVKRYERERTRNKSTYWMIFELIWRDFFAFIGWKYGDRLFHQSGPMNVQVDWADHEPSFEAWATGTTGIPFVDANMRELNQTGFMSNRGRQNVASMLAKSLNIDWRRGAAYFEARLVDYDVTSNWGNWAYNSGVGNDPRNRYFNIVKQAKRYDSDGDYVRHWLPELSDVPDHYVHEPHTMSHEEQQEYGCVIGADYPEPIVDLETTYERLRGG